jgi:hypothetical protein
MEKTKRRPRLPGVVNPQKKKVKIAQATGGIADTVWAERRIFLLSLSHPKKEEAIMPGALKRASISVPEV